MRRIRAVVFDWGDTLMRDYPQFSGPMAHWPHVELLPEVAETLAQLQGRWLCGVASNAGDSDAALLGAALDRVAIRGHFAHLWTSRELGATKPDPEFFHAVSGALGFQPFECVYVGNDYVKDIQAAHAAGWRTVWLVPYGIAESTSAANATIRGMGELIPILTGWDTAGDA